MFAGLIILEIPYFLLTNFFSSMTTRSYFLSGFTLGVLFASAKSRLFASLLSLTCPSKGNKLPRGPKFQTGNPNAKAAHSAKRIFPHYHLTLIYRPVSRPCCKSPSEYLHCQISPLPINRHLIQFVLQGKYMLYP